MRILAYITLGLNALGLLIAPLNMGKPRKPYSYSDFVATVVGSSMLLALCGRVIGWW